MPDDDNENSHHPAFQSDVTRMTLKQAQQAIEAGTLHADELRTALAPLSQSVAKLMSKQGLQMQATIRSELSEYTTVFNRQITDTFRQSMSLSNLLPVMKQISQTMSSELTKTVIQSAADYTSITARQFASGHMIGIAEFTGPNLAFPAYDSIFQQIVPRSFFPLITEPHVAETAELEIARLGVESEITWDSDDRIVIPEVSYPQLAQVVSEIVSAVEEIVTPADVTLIVIAVLLGYILRSWSLAIGCLYSLYGPMLYGAISEARASEDSDDPES